MALRRREKRTERSKIDATPPWDAKQRAEPDPTEGPYDVRDAPEDDVARIDLGGLLVPAAQGIDLRLDLDENQRVISATLVDGQGQMQLGVFAAPRNESIWDDIRTEIRASLSEQGGKGEDVEDGPFGTELVGTLRVDGKLTPVRFIGVSGPRWFLRAMLVGPAVNDKAKAARFEEILRGVVVVRGSDPLPVREAVPLVLPKQVADQAEQAAVENAAANAATEAADSSSDPSSDEA